MAASESYPEGLKYHRRARLGADRRRRGDARGHVVRAGRARRARPLRAAGRGRLDGEGLLLRRGRVGQGRLGRDRAALRRDPRGEPEGRRRARDGERGSIRRRLARPDSPVRPGRGGQPARRGGVQAAPGRAVAVSQLSLTDSDREEMLAAIGVASVEELFRDIPAGVRFQGELDLEPALSEPELVRHLEELAAKNVDTTKELSFLGAGIYDHYVPGGRRRGAAARRVPDRVHAVPAGAEPGRAAGDLRVPDRDLRADRDGRLERVRLRRDDRRRRRLLRREARDRPRRRSCSRRR